MMKKTKIVLNQSKPIEDAVDELTKKIEKRNKAYEKKLTKKPTKITITIPKGCHPKETRRRVQEYVNATLSDDHDWDFAYLLDLIIYKLSRMQKCILKNNIIEDANKICFQMKEVEEALKRVRDDEYLVNKIDALHEKHQVKTGTVKLPDGMYQLKTLPKKKGETFDEEAYDRKFKEACELADKEREADLEIAFDGMKRNVLSWWE